MAYVLHASPRIYGSDCAGPRRFLLRGTYMLNRNRKSGMMRRFATPGSIETIGHLIGWSSHPHDRSALVGVNLPQIYGLMSD